MEDMTVQHATRAEAIARQAHATQIEGLTGDPYFYHLERVVALVEGLSVHPASSATTHSTWVSV